MYGAEMRRFFRIGAEAAGACLPPDLGGVVVTMSERSECVGPVGPAGLGLRVWV